MLRYWDLHGDTIVTLRLSLLAITLLFSTFAAAYSAEQAAPTQNDDKQLQQRHQFRQAYLALRAGDQSVMADFHNEQPDYLLHPYANYFLLQAKLSANRNKRSSGLDKAMVRFLRDHADIPVTNSLRRNWLKHLGRSGQWRLYLQHYREQSNTVLQCHYLRARLIVSKKISAKDKTYIQERALNLWSRGSSQPDECDHVFGWLRKNRLITSSAVLKRLENALLNGNTKLAQWLSIQLNKENQAITAHWFELMREPEARLFSSLFKARNYTPKLIEKAIKNIAREDADKAQRRLEKIRSHLGDWPNQKLDALQEFVAIRLALQKENSALVHAEKAFFSNPSKAMAEWWLRALIEKQDWPRLLVAATDIQEKLPNNRMVQYWRAEAFERLGNKKAALKSYQQAAKKLDYYGLLAADKAQETYPINHINSPAVEQTILDGLERNPRLARARELRAVELYWLARSEWYHAFRDAQADESAKPNVVKAQFGALAKAWHWPSRMINAAVRKPQTSTDFYPISWFATVNKLSPKDVKVPWVYGLMRQESLFTPDIRSSAGAIGLMQLMPSTAKRTAKKHKLEWKGIDSLNSPKSNIALGTAHLQDLLKIYNGDYIQATAAYNAGKNAVNRWQPELANADPVAWIELVPYRETRNYIKKVLTNTAIYEHKLHGKKALRLSSYMLKPQAGASKNSAQEQKAAREPGA